MAGSTVPLAFGLLTFTLAYLAINTDERYASLQIGNYVLTYIAMFFTGFLSYSYASSSESPSQLLIGWNNSFIWIVILVAAVFVIRILNAVLEAMGKEVL